MEDGARDLRRRETASTIVDALRQLHKAFLGWLPSYDPTRDPSHSPALLFMVMTPYVDATVGAAATAIRSAIQEWAPDESSRSFLDGYIVKPESEILERYVSLAPSGAWHLEHAEWLVGQLLDLTDGIEEPIRVRFGFVGLQLTRNSQRRLLETDLALDEGASIRVWGEGEAEEIRNRSQSLNRRWYGSTEGVILDVFLRAARGMSGAVACIEKARELATIAQGTVMMTVSGRIFLVEIDHSSTNPFGSLRHQMILRDSPRPVPDDQIALDADSLRSIRDRWDATKRVVLDEDHYLRRPFFALVDGVNRVQDTDGLLEFVKGLEMLLTVGLKNIGKQLTRRAAVLCQGNPKPEDIERLWSIRNQIAHGKIRGHEYRIDPEILRYSMIGQETLRRTWNWFFENYPDADSARPGIAALDTRRRGLRGVT